MATFMTARAKAVMDYEAPDKSEIRLLTDVKGSSMCLVTLKPGGVSQAKVHKTVDEQWFFTQGIGQVWRKEADYSEIVDVGPGVAITVPLGVHFQFRNTGWEPLSFICVDSPKWPAHGEAAKTEATPVKGNW
jgi:mannose-6-phosphate isomerase-like protein (cupin superfamily)